MTPPKRERRFENAAIAAHSPADKTRSYQVFPTDPGNPIDIPKYYCSVFTCFYIFFTVLGTKVVARFMGYFYLELYSVKTKNGTSNRLDFEERQRR